MPVERWKALTERPVGWRVALVAGAVVIGILGYAGGRSDGREAPGPVVAMHAMDEGAEAVAPMPPPPVPLPTGDEIGEMVEPPEPSRAPMQSAVRVRPTGWYQMAAVEYRISPQLLEALHQVESGGAPDGCIRNYQGSGATGPFQFKPATFSQFGVDANHDGIADICGFADSLFSAAHYLQRIGADAEPSSAASRRALARYGTDVDRVVLLAQAYQDRDRLN